jgi:hypothetical protein
MLQAELCHSRDCLLVPYFGQLTLSCCCCATRVADPMITMLLPLLGAATFRQTCHAKQGRQDSDYTASISGSSLSKQL